MTARIAPSKSTRRDLLKLAGAAAIGAAGATALSATRVRAAGSGTTIVPYLNPVHIASGTLAAGQEVVIGPFAFPGSTFDSQSYSGIVGNLTAMRWSGAGWLSVRSTDYAFNPGHQALNLHFAGRVPAWSNSFVSVFGFTNVIPGMASDGRLILRNGPSATDYVIDVLAFLGPDQ